MDAPGLPSLPQGCPALVIGASGAIGGANVGRSLAEAAADLLRALDGLPDEASGSFHSHRGERLPW